MCALCRRITSTPSPPLPRSSQNRLEQTPFSPSAKKNRDCAAHPGTCVVRRICNVYDNNACEHACNRFSRDVTAITRPVLPSPPLPSCSHTTMRNTKRTLDKKKQYTKQMNETRDDKPTIYTFVFRNLRFHFSRAFSRSRISPLAPLLSPACSLARICRNNERLRLQF